MSSRKSSFRYLNPDLMFSLLRKAIEDGQGRAPAKQWINIIKSLRNKRVKEAEVTDTNILNPIESQEGNLTKQDILSYLDKTRVTTPFMWFSA